MVPLRTMRLTRSSAKKSPNLRETAHASMTGGARSEEGIDGGAASRLVIVRPSLASSFGHRDEGGHSRAQITRTFAQPDARREHLVRPLVGRLQIARRVFAHAIDVLDHALKGLVRERIDRDRHLVADVDPPDERLRNVDADVELRFLE